MNLASRIENHFPAPVLDALRKAGDEARGLGLGLYFAGGAVRDLLLSRRTSDIDIVAEGDAVALARRLAPAAGARLAVHPRFGTATLGYAGFRLDVAMARSETYDRPGALPTVRPSDIRQDLFRRDFTINAMAVRLVPELGELVDPFGGQADLEKGLVRVLHDRSFVDDATRIWRALRYEQRLGLTLEKRTLELVLRDRDMLDTISGDRLRRELELVLKEEDPEKAIARAGELGVLQKLHPSLRGDDWLARKFGDARRLEGRGQLEAIYLGLLVYRLHPHENERLLERLNVPKGLARVTRDTLELENRLGDLEAPGATPGTVYALLEGYLPAALQVVLVASDSPVARRNLHLYLTRLRRTRTSLTGEDIQAMGVEPGPRIGAVLRQILLARLDGRVKTGAEERKLAQELLASYRGPASP